MVYMMSDIKIFRIYIVFLIGALFILFTPLYLKNGEPTTIDLDTPTIISENRNWGINYNEDDVNCLALNIYFEARGEPIRGQYAVADVVVYRAQHVNYPNTICGVIKHGYYHSWNPELPIKHRCNFSWYCDGRSDDPVDSDAFEQSMFIANDILTDPHYPGMIDYAIFYHADYVEPVWAQDKELVAKIGSHYFYQ